MADPVIDGQTPKKSWLAENGISMAIIIAVAALVFWKLHVVDVLIAGFGLSFIIFIHELGHFLAAKFCDVHVKTFSIGLGPAIPFCSYKWGETTYKLAMIPLGGFVSMVGQEDGVVDESADPDPRSYRNKSVPQRMLIISAGVIMNILLAGACFLAAYMHGVDENPAVVAQVEPGGAAWRAGVKTGSRITQVGSVNMPSFADLKPIVMSTQKGEQLPISIQYGSETRDIKLEPVREEGAPFPVLGVAFPSMLETINLKRSKDPVTYPGSGAALAKDANGQGIQPGDKIIAMTDPGDPTKLSEFQQADFYYFEYRERLAKLAGKPVTIRMQGPTTREFTISPHYHRDLGMRMQMGPITAVRAGSAAEQAGVAIKAGANPGDKIVAVEVTTAGGSPMKWSNDTTPNTNTKPLDPIRLPFELNAWADTNPKDKSVKLTVRREVDHKEQSVTLPPIMWDDSFRYEISAPTSAYAPQPISGLGIAYHVLSTVDIVTPGGPAEALGLKGNDEIVAIRFLKVDDKTKLPVTTTDEKSFEEWRKIEPVFWANANEIYQDASPAHADSNPYPLGVKVKRGAETIEYTIMGKPDLTWPRIDDRGMVLKAATEFKQAQSVGEALAMGWKRTTRTIRSTYLSLYGLITGRTSVTQISGPITLARVSYLFAGQDVWQLLVLMGVISVNLAVVNFLPIPVLDGGHMVFLAYEGIRGKPASERVQEYLVYVGLACVGSLMLLSIGMDIWRIFRGG